MDSYPPKNIVKLPTSTLIVLPSDVSPSRPHLKIHFIPHILIPCPPFAPGASGKKVEECVDTIVDIGGTIDLTLEVDRQSLEWLNRGEGWDDESQMEQSIKSRVKGLFESNIDRIGCLIKTLKIDHSAESQHPQITPQPLIQLSPLIANPSHSQVLKTITTTGRPQAMLSRLEIKLEWHQSKLKHQDEEKVTGIEYGEEVEVEDDSQDSGQSGESDEIYKWNDDEFCIGEDGDATSSFEDDMKSEIEESGGETDDDDVLPHWINIQLKEGIHKLIRTHMIRSLLKPARNLFHSIAQEQETYLKYNIDAASRIRGSYSRGIDGEKIKKGKKRKIQAEGDDQAVSPNPDERVKMYMSQIHEMMLDPEGMSGKRADERRIERLISEAMGRIGRGKWESARRGIGRMAAFRIQLNDVQVQGVKDDQDHPIDLDEFWFDTEAQKSIDTGPEPLLGELRFHATEELEDGFEEYILEDLTMIDDTSDVEGRDGSDFSAVCLGHEADNEMLDTRQVESPTDVTYLSSVDRFTMEGREGIQEIQEVPNYQEDLQGQEDQSTNELENLSHHENGNDVLAFHDSYINDLYPDLLDDDGGSLMELESDQGNWSGPSSRHVEILDKYLIEGSLLDICSDHHIHPV